MSAAKANGISSAAVLKATDRTWDEWFALLDADEAHLLPHPEIAILLSQKHGAPDWWSQMITVAYEQERGLRKKHELVDGYAASASKTIDVPRERLFAAWANEEERARWLPNAPFTLRKATEPKSLRITWEGDSKVDTDIYAKGDSRSQVTVQHTRLADEGSAASMKEYWRDALVRLKEYLEQK